MSDLKLYYTAPKDYIFLNMMLAAREVYKEIGNEDVYSRANVKRIELVTNVADNFMFIFCQFDEQTALNLLRPKLSVDTLDALSERLAEVNHPLAKRFKAILHE